MEINGRLIHLCTNDGAYRSFSQGLFYLFLIFGDFNVSMQKDDSAA